MATYVDAIAYLNQEYPFFANMVMNIGNPILSADCDTLAVVSSLEDACGFKFVMNPDYISKLTVEQLGGALGHETLHIALGHLQEIQDPKYTNANALMIAHEIICNDRLANEGFELPDGVFYGYETIGEDASPMTTDEAYKLVYEKLEETAEGSEGSQSGSDNAAAEGGDGIPSETMCSNHSSGQNLDSTTADALRDAMIASANEYSKTSNTDIPNALAGTDAGSEMTSKSNFAGEGYSEISEEEFASENNVSLNWAKLLKEIDPDIFKNGGKMPAKRTVDWSRRPRRYASMPKGYAIPSYENKRESDPREDKGNNKPLIVLALDLSGSIDEKWKHTLVKIAKSIPVDKMHVECCTFSTYHVRYDLNSNNNQVAAGGTDFSAVENFARSTAAEYKLDYPKAIIVITDGEARFNKRAMEPTYDQLVDNWKWLEIRTEYYSRYSYNPSNLLPVLGVPESAIYDAKDFVT